MAKKRKSDAELMLELDASSNDLLFKNVPQAQNAGIPEATGQPPQGVGQSSLGFGQETEQTASTPIGGGDILPELASSIWKKTKEAVAQAYKDPTKEFLALGGSVISEFQALMTDLPNSINDAIQGGAIRARLKETEFTDQDLIAFGSGPNGEKLTIDEAKERKRDFLVNNALRNPVADALSGYATRKLIGKYFDSRPDEKGDPTGFDKFLGVGKEQVVGKSIGSVASMALGGWAGKAAKIPKLGQAFMFNMEFQGYMDDVKEQRGDAAMSDPTTLASGLIYATISSIMEQKMGLNPLEIGAGKVAREAIKKGALQAAEEVTERALGYTAKGGFLRGAGRAVVNTGADALQEMSQQGASDLIKTGAEYLDAGSTDNPLKGVMTDPKKQREVLSKYAENAVGAFFGSGVFSTIRSASGEKEANNAAYDYIRNGVGDLRTLPQQVAEMFVPSELSGEGAKSIAARADLVKKSAIEDSEVEIEKVKGLPIAEEEKVAQISKLEETRDKAIKNIDAIANLAINVPLRVGEAASFQAYEILEKKKAVKELVKADTQLTGDEDIDNAALALNDSDIKAREELLNIYDNQLKEIGKDGATTINKKEQALLRQVGLSEYAEPILDKKDAKLEGVVNEGLLLNDETSFVAPNGKAFVKDNGRWVGLEKISEADAIDNVDPVTGVKSKEIIPAKYRVDQKLDTTDKQDSIQAAYEASGSAKRVQGQADAETKRIEDEQKAIETAAAQAELDLAKAAKAESDQKEKDAKAAHTEVLREKARLGLKIQEEKVKQAELKTKADENKASAAELKELKIISDSILADEAAAEKNKLTEAKTLAVLEKAEKDSLLADQKIEKAKEEVNLVKEKIETQKAKTEQVKSGKPGEKSTFEQALSDKGFKAFFDKLEPHIMYGLQVQDVPWESVSDISLDENDESGDRASVKIPGFGWANIPFELVGGDKVFKYFIAKGIDEYSEKDLLHFPHKGEIFAVTPEGEVSINRRNPGVRIRVANSSLTPDGKQTDKKSPDLTKREGILKGIKKAFESGSSGSDAVKEAVTLIYENYKNGLVALNIGDVAHIANKIAEQGEVWSGELDARFIELFNLGMDLGSSKKEAAFAKLAKEMGMNVGKMVSDIALSTVIDKAQAVRDIVINQAFKDGLLTDVKIRELKNRQLNEKPTIVDRKDRGAEYTGGENSEGANQEVQSSQPAAAETQANGEGAAVAEKPSTETTKSTESGGRDAGAGKTGTTKGAKAPKNNDVDGKSDKTLFDGEPISVRHSIMKRLAYGNIGIIRKGIQDLFNTQKDKDFSSDTTRMGFLWQKGKQLFETIDALADAIFEADESDGFAFGSIDDYMAEIDDVLRSWNLKDYRKQIADEIRAASIMPDWMVDQAEYEYEQEKRDEESLANSPYSGISYGDTQAPFSIDDYLKQIGDIINEGDQGIAFSPEKEADRIYRLTVAVKNLALALIKEGVATINNVIKEVGKRVKVDKAVLDAAQEQLDVQFSATSDTGFVGRDGNKIGYTYDTDKLARERFDFSKLKQIGKGSDRAVFLLDNGNVLKVAHTPRGLAQNIYEGDYYLKGILPEVFERGLNYVVVENIARAKSADKITTYDAETGDENGESTVGNMIKELSRFSQRDMDNNKSELQDALTKYGFSDINSYNVIYNDFTALRNWGYKDGVAYHIDGGTFGGVQMLDEYKGVKPLSDPEFREIYEKSKAAKRQLGDKDSYIRFQKTAPTQSDSIEQVKKLAAKMSGKFKGSKIKFFTDKDRNIDGIQLKIGEKVWGIKASDGTIYLNLDGISFEAAIHEFSHLWEAVYPSKFLEGVSILEKTEEGKALFKELRANKSYDNLTDNQIWREALNTAIGRKGQDLFKGTKLMRFKEYLKSFFRGVAERFGKFTATPDMKLKDFLNLAVGEITNKGGNYKNKTKKQFMKLPDGRMGEIMSPEVVNGFYSPLEKIILETRFNKLPEKQWLEKFGKGDEAKWTGLTDWLGQQQGSVSKKDIQNYLKDNRIEIVEVVKGGEQKVHFNIKAEKGKSVVYKNGVKDKEFDTYDKADDYVTNYKESEVDATKFSQYQLEGEKSKYKEVLVTMPNNSKYQNELNRLSKKYNAEANYKSLRESKATDSELEILRNLNTKGEKFKSSHFDEPNILVHLRMNTRVDAEGNKVLFLEEVQSDWGQKGKKEGFEISQSEKIKEIEKKLKAAWEKQSNETDFLKRGEIYETEVKPLGFALEEAKNQNRIQKTPTAPFVTDTNAWTKLGLKVALKEAVAQGADKIAWTTGEQQNDRYDLSKQVDKIDVESVEDVDNLFFVDIKLSSGTTENLEVENGIIREGNYEGQRLDNVVGKDYADKILSTPKGEMATLEGEDLKVGGKGMKGFYGSPSEGSLGIVGNLAKSLFKQTPKTLEIETGIKTVRNWEGAEKLGFSVIKKSDYKYASGNTSDFVVVGEDGYAVTSANTKEEAISKFLKTSNLADSKQATTSTQNSIDITPELRQQVAEGLPLFLAYQFNAAMAFGDGRFESGTEVDLGLDPSQNLVEQLVQTDWSDMLEKDNFDQLFDNFVAPIHEDISGKGNPVWQEILGNEDLRELVRAEIIDESSEKEIVDKVSKIGTKDDTEVGKKIKEVAKQLRDNEFFKSEIPNMSPYVYYDEIENKFYKIDAKKEAALVKKSGVFVGAIARLMGSSKQLDTILLGLQEPGGFLSKIRVMMQGEALDRKDKVKDRLKKKLMALIDKFPELTNQTTERPITFDGVTINLSEAFSLFLQDERVLRETGSRFIGGLKTFQDIKGDTHPLNDYQAFYDALDAGMKKYGNNTLAAAKADFESFFNDSVVKENMRPAMLVTQGITDFKLGVPIIEAADDRPFLMASFSPGTPRAASGKVEGKVLHSLPLNEVMANHMSQVENFIEAAEYTHHVEQWNKKYGKSAYEFKPNPNAGMAQKLKDAVSSKLLKNAFPESLDSRIKNVGGTGKLKTLKFLQFLSNSMSRSQFALNLSSGAIQSLGIVSLAVSPMRRGYGKAIVQFFKKSATSIGPVFEALTNIANNKKYERMTRHDVEDYLNASWLPFKKLGWADTVAEMKKHSPYLYGRLNNSFFEINEILRDSSEIRGNYKNKQAEALNRLGRNLSINQTVGDIGVIIAEWQMSKKEYMNNPITVPYNGSKIVLKGFEAVAFAAKANVQATQVVHDMSQMTNLKMAAQRGDQVAQLISAMFPFITENLKRMNMAAFYAMQKEAPAGFTNAQWQIKRKLAFPTAMAAMTIGYKLLSGLWSSLRFDCGTEKMDEVFDRVLSVPKTGIQTTDLLTNMVGAPPILGQLSYQMKGLDTKTVKKYGDDYEWGEFGKSFHPTDVVADLVTIGYAKKIEKELMDDTRDGSLDAEEYGMWAVEAASALAGIPKTLLAIADCFRR